MLLFKNWVLSHDPACLLCYDILEKALLCISSDTWLVIGGNTWGRVFSVVVPRIWNSLPSEIHAVCSHLPFRPFLKMAVFCFALGPGWGFLLSPPISGCCLIFSVLIMGSLIFSSCLGLWQRLTFSPVLKWENYWGKWNDEYINKTLCAIISICDNPLEAWQNGK